MPTYFLGNGNQTVRYDTFPDWSIYGSEVYGGNGNDDISVYGFGLVLSGENGNDTVSGAGFGNQLLGGNGDDRVEANGLYNKLDGGRGDDFLLSTGGGGTYQVGTGNILIGGPGHDPFAPIGSKDLVVTNDGGDGVVSAGDVVTGVFDVITDYHPGDAIQTHATERVEQVPFDPYELPPPYIHPNALDHEHLLLLAGQYAVFRGDSNAPGQFTVGPDGKDLLVVWDQGPNDNHIFQWGVVLDSFSNPDAVWVV